MLVTTRFWRLSHEQSTSLELRRVKEVFECLILLAVFLGESEHYHEEVRKPQSKVPVKHKASAFVKSSVVFIALTPFCHSFNYSTDHNDW